jgi:hypothetical protein
MWIQAKSQLKDWMGVLEITKGCAPTPTIITARARAYSALADIALKTTNYQRAAQHFLAGGKDIHEAMRMPELRGRQGDLRTWRDGLLQSYIQVLDRSPQPDDERLAVWQACLDVFRCDAGDVKLLSIGGRNLATWWKAVENRARHDEKAMRIMQQQLRALHALIGEVVAQERRGTEDDVHQVQLLATDLQGRCNLYAHQSVKATPS